MGRGQATVAQDQFSAVFGDRRGSFGQVEMHAYSVMATLSTGAGALEEGMRNVPSSIAPGFDFCMSEGNGVIIFCVHASSKEDAQEQLLAACAYVLGQVPRGIEVNLR